MRDLDTISRCEIPFRCRRDCAEIAQPNPGHLEALPSDGARRAYRGGIGNGRVRSDSTKWPSTVVLDAWVHLGAFWRVCASCRKSPSNTHAPTTTVLGHFVESERTRPFPISPRCTLQAPSLSWTCRCPGCICTISPQSRYIWRYLVIARLQRDCADASWAFTGPTE